MNATATAITSPFSSLVNAWGKAFPKPFFLGQILKADLIIGQMSDGQRIGYPYCPGLKIMGCGYRFMTDERTGQEYEDLAGMVVRLPDWGFKTPIQFQVAYKVAKSYGHQWAQPTYVTVRKPQPNGATKLVEEPIDPQNPWDAAMTANIRLLEENKSIGFQLAQHTVPTPKWESGSGTYKVSVHSDGTYTIITNAILQETFSPNGQRISASTVPGWQAVDFTWNWLSKTHNGRGQSLQESVKLAIKKGDKVDLSLVEVFESDRNFWRTGFVAGTRWYE